MLRNPRFWRLVTQRFWLIWVQELLESVNVRVTEQTISFAILISIVSPCVTLRGTCEKSVSHFGNDNTLLYRSTEQLSHVLFVNLCDAVSLYKTEITESYNWKKRTYRVLTSVPPELKHPMHQNTERQTLFLRYMRSRKEKVHLMTYL